MFVARVAVSWVCLRFLERMNLALGFALRGDWYGDVLKGCAISGVMIAAVVALQIAGGGTRLSFNPILSQGQGGVNWAGVRTVAAEMVAALALLILAAAFEELIFRGYAFQTLLRGAPAIVPILLFSIFRMGPLAQPEPDSLIDREHHACGRLALDSISKNPQLMVSDRAAFRWNWTMGVFFGIPISGLRMGVPSVTSDDGAGRLTGGSYGSEGGGGGDCCTHRRDHHDLARAIVARLP